jgi:hypothetical protein
MINKDIGNFLLELIKKFENGNLSQPEKEIILEMYLKFNSIENKNKENKENFSENQLEKYLFAGWYLYNLVNVSDN